jgi:6-phospho-3-hexuloisomerase
MRFDATVNKVLSEVQACLGEIEQRRVREFIRALGSARRVFVTGQGRSGLVGRAFAMRLMHLGFRAHVVGEATTPAIRKGDLLVAISASGSTSTTCHHAEAAQKAGAKVAALTATLSSPLAQAAHVLIEVPTVGRAVRPSPRSAQFSTTLFEQGTLLCLDALCLALMKQRKTPAAAMRGRHANLE